MRESPTQGKQVLHPEQHLTDSLSIHIDLKYFFKSFTKINSRGILDQNVKHKAIRLLQDYTGEKI